MDSIKEEYSACRACLSNDVLFDWNERINDTYGPTYRDCFLNWTHLHISADDPLPQMLCSCCAADLRTTYEFVEKARNSDKLLRRAIEQHIALMSPSSDERPLHEYLEVISKNEDEGIISADRSDEYKLYSASEGDNESETEVTTSNLEMRSRTEPASEVYTNESYGDMCSSSKSVESDVESLDNEWDAEDGTRKTELEKELFDDSSADEQPKQSSNKTARRTYLCHICSKICKSLSGFHIHQRAHDENRERKFACEHCDLRFFTRPAYRGHLETHIVDRKPKHKCESCDKAFFHKGALNVHRRIHTGDMVPCMLCSKQFFRKIDLEMHMRTHSGDTPYKCTICKKEFANRRNLREHLLMHEDIQHKCDMCDRVFNRQSSLREHRATHTGVPFKCSFCKKGFVDKYKIRRHIRNVHKVDDPGEVDAFIMTMQIPKVYKARKLRLSSLRNTKNN